MVPQRETFWNIQFGPVMYGLAAIVVLLLIYAFYRRYKLWRLGQPESRIKGNLGRRWKVFLNTVVVDGLIHRKFFGVADNLGHRRFTLQDLVPRELYIGVAHFLIFAGFIVLFLGTATDAISHYVYDFLTGNVYLAQILILDIAGVAVIIGAVMAMLRRYIQKPERLDNQPGDLFALLALLVIVVTGFFIQAVRLAYDGPPWAWWTPAGNILSFAFGGVNKDTLLVIHRSLWWFHVAVALGSMAYVALFWNRLWHIVVSPLNIFYRNLEARGAMVPINMETAEHFGVSKVEDLSWKNLLDLDACTRCGRCTDICPARQSGKPLNPKMVLQDLKGVLAAEAPALLAARAKPSIKETEPEGGNQPPVVAEDKKPLIGGVISTDAIWNCTTCYACQEVCPVWAEPMFKIGEMRRNLVLDQASIPETAEGALRSIEDRGHPWRGTQLTRTSWSEGLGIRTLAEDRDVDFLYWVGCTSALEDRSLNVAQATGKLFQQAGLKFGVLGMEESCCGDPARRLGNEYLYQMQAQKNIEILKSYGIRKIVTGCPHCFNTLKNEYPQFGGDFEVLHHSEFILRLLEQGKLGILKSPGGIVTYHDPCYLGRYNNLYEAPRRLLNYLPDITLVEMARNRERSFCCGAGGGHMWLEEQKVGERINALRTDQALTTQSRIVATACPYCLQMFEDGIKTRAAEDRLKVMDISELLAASAVYGRVHSQVKKTDL